MAYCDVCGNFDESYRKRWSTPKIPITVYKTINPIAITIGIHL